MYNNAHDLELDVSPPPKTINKKKKRKKVDPSKPKRPMSAFMYFSRDYRAVLKEQNPTASFGELGKLLGSSWRNLDKEERQKYDSLAREDRLRYESELALVPRKPKKPLSAFMLFSNENRAQIKDENPDATFADTGKLLGAKWRAASDEEKAKYQKLADEDKMRYADDCEKFKVEHPSDLED
jgi:structure-specific recognition protein 1